MGKLDHLKIKSGPACFEPWAKNFNEQVDLLGSIQGGPGIDVQVAHSPRKTVSTPGQSKPREQPRGKILMTLRPSAINGIGVGGGSGGNGTSFAVGAAGALVPVVTTGNTTGNYPTYLQTGAGPTQGTFFADSVTNGGSIGLYGNGATFEAIASQILHDIGVRTFVGCNSGAPGNYDTFASDFYP